MSHCCQPEAGGGCSRTGAWAVKVNSSSRQATTQLRSHPSQPPHPCCSPCSCRAGTPRQPAHDLAHIAARRAALLALAQRRRRSLLHASARRGEVEVVLHRIAQGVAQRLAHLQRRGSQREPWLAAADRQQETGNAHARNGIRAPASASEVICTDLEQRAQLVVSKQAHHLELRSRGSGPRKVTKAGMLDPDAPALVHCAGPLRHLRPPACCVSYSAGRWWWCPGHGPWALSLTSSSPERLQAATADRPPPAAGRARYAAPVPCAAAGDACAAQR